MTNENNATGIERLCTNTAERRRQHAEYVAKILENALEERTDVDSELAHQCEFRLKIDPPDHDKIAKYVANVAVAAEYGVVYRDYEHSSGQYDVVCVYTPGYRIEIHGTNDVVIEEMGDSE